MLIGHQHKPASRNIYKVRKARWVLLLCVLLSAGSQAQNWYATGSDAGWQSGEDAVYVPSEGWVVESEGFSSLSTQSSGQRWDTWYRVDENAREARVTLFPGSSPSVLDVQNKTKIGDRKWRVEGSKQQIDSLEDTPVVFSVLPMHPGFVQPNQRSRELIEANEVQTLPQNLTGDGFTAGVWDVGNSSASKALAGNHTDFDFRNSKVVAGEQDIQVGEHGTHVTGTLLGAGRLNNRRRGVAPNASAVGFVAPPFESELEEETNKTINVYEGVVSQNSWGAVVFCDSGVGDYDLGSGSYDKYISNRSADVDGTLTTVFAAGNKRSSCPQKYNTTIPPATAKNVISVAALRNTTDTTSFSSTGPTDDGRIKPDISALGLSVKSTVPGDSYTTKSGTSMAAPAISGAVVLLNEQFNETNRDPAPATTKGVLIHTAEDINLPGPDYLAGWGRANISDAADYAEKSSSQDIIKRSSVQQGENDTYSLEVDRGVSFNITLVWSDPPAPSGARETLVNDLDLVVSSSGQRFFPWTINYSTRSSGATRNQEDHTNNVEQVHIPETPNQSIEIKIQGSSTPIAPQTYSLLLPREERLTSPPNLTIKQPTNTTLANRPDINVLTGEDLESINFTLGQKNNGLQRISDRNFTNNSFNPDPGQSQLEVRIRDTDGEENSSSVTFTYDPFKPNVTILSPEDNSSFQEEFDLNITGTDNITSVELSSEISNASGTVTRVSPNVTVDGESLAEGEYNITVSSTDAANNTATENLSLRIDRTPPDLQALTPRFGSGNISVNASISDVSPIATTSFNLSNSTSSTTKQLNQTINTSLLEDGDYNLSLIATDTAGNKGRNTTDLTIDNTPPETTLGTDNFVSNRFNTTLFIQDSTNTTAELALTNTTFNRTLEFNSSINASNLSQGNYTLEANITDSAGNLRSNSIDIKVDQSPPNLTILKPENQTTLTGDTNIEVIATDRETSVNSVDFTLKGLVSRRNGTLNKTLNTRPLADGNYTLDITALDKAANTNSTQLTVRLDNAPSIASTTIPRDGNISGAIDVNLSFREASGIDASSFTVLNATGNRTGKRDINTTLNTRELADGDYNLSIQANDTKGNQLETNVSFTSDNTAPELSVNLSKPDRSGYHRLNATAEINCSDQTSGIGRVKATPGPSSDSGDVNLTLTRQGNNTIEFICLDQARNQNNEPRDIAIDRRPPRINETGPENLSTTGTDTDIRVEIDDLSGLNTSDTRISASGADASTSTDRNAVDIQVNGAKAGEDYTLKLSVSDLLNQSNTFLLRYDTESEDGSSSSSEDSNGGGGGGGSGGGGGGFSTDTTETEPSNEDFNEDEIENDTKDVTSTAQTEPGPNSSNTEKQNSTSSLRNQSREPSREGEFQTSKGDDRLGTAQLEDGDQLLEIPGSVVGEEERIELRQLDGNTTATAELVRAKDGNLTYRTSAAAGEYAVVRSDGERSLTTLVAAAGTLLIVFVGALYLLRFRDKEEDGDLTYEIELLRDAIRDSELPEEERQKASLRVQEALRQHRDGDSQKAKEILKQVRENV
jgi:uncharacterized membrane protein YgcG